MLADSFHALVFELALLDLYYEKYVDEGSSL